MTVQAFSTVVFRLMSELEGIHSYKLERRLGNFLLLHASTEGLVRMTQQEIASHLGTTREVIARALGQLASPGASGPVGVGLSMDDPLKLGESVKRPGTQ